MVSHEQIVPLTEEACVGARERPQRLDEPYSTPAALTDLLDDPGGLQRPKEGLVASPSHGTVDSPPPFAQRRRGRFQSRSITAFARDLSSTLKASFESLPLIWLQDQQAHRRLLGFHSSPP